MALSTWFYLTRPNFVGFDNFASDEAWSKKCGRRLRAIFEYDAGFTHA
jgi:hypothetical protein